MLLKDKKILLGITGSIAAYKSAILVRLLSKAGAEVRVVMTPAATDFISPLTLSTLSRYPVTVNLAEENTWANHVMLGRLADLMLIAPLSCNTLSKIAAGACDNLLMAVVLSATCPVWLAPAMDEDMWKHPATINNIKKAQEYGYEILPVESGELASGLIGPGRMAEPELILQQVIDFFSHAKDFEGKKILITAGATQEAIDPVRYISNHSTGKMGFALAKAFHKRGAEVHLVHGPVNIPLPEGCIYYSVVNADEMYQQSIKLFPEMNIAVLSAAVADYTPEIKQDQKIKKLEEVAELKLIKTKDILLALGEKKTSNQFVVGFALETDNEVNNAILKLKKKKADMIVLNSLLEEGAGFGHDTNKVILFAEDGTRHESALLSKTEIAEEIVNVVKSKIKI